MRSVIPYCLLVLALGIPAALAEEAPEKIAPAFRSERHFAQGADYLRGLPEGTVIDVKRGDGFVFSLRLNEGLLKVELPETELEDEDRTLVLPSGYALKFMTDAPPGLQSESPLGRVTRLSPTRERVRAQEGDGGLWDTNFDPLVLRFPDGSRLDVIELGKRWELLTLSGRRFLMVLPDVTWREQPRLPSPPLIPEMRTFYLSGDGDDWRLTVKEDHSVFAWNWYQFGLSIDRVLKDVEREDRRLDLTLYFNKLETVQRAADMAACVLGRRLALIGGDSVTFRAPGKDPETGFIFPGSLDPDFAQPSNSMPTNLPMPQQRFKE